MFLVTYLRNIGSYMGIKQTECYIVENSYKNLPSQTSTVLLTEVIREEKLPCYGLSPRRARALISADNDM